MQTKREIVSQPFSFITGIALYIVFDFYLSMVDIIPSPKEPRQTEAYMPVGVLYEHTW